MDVARWAGTERTLALRWIRPDHSRHRTVLHLDGIRGCLRSLRITVKWCLRCVQILQAPAGHGPGAAQHVAVVGVRHVVDVVDHVLAARPQVDVLSNGHLQCEMDILTPELIARGVADHGGYVQHILLLGISELDVRSAIEGGLCRSSTRLAFHFQMEQAIRTALDVQSCPTALYVAVLHVQAFQIDVQVPIVVVDAPLPIGVLRLHGIQVECSARWLDQFDLGQGAVATLEVPTDVHGAPESRNEGQAPNGDQGEAEPFWCTCIK